MQLLPSITVSHGRTARLWKGAGTDERIFDVSPIDVAKQFEDHGIHQIHLVDMDGAKKGNPVNYDTLQLIRGYTSLEINFAGGIHTDGDLNKSFEHGATTITAGSVAALKPELFASWIMSYGREKLMLSADVLNDSIKIRGWQETTQINPIEHIEYFYNRGLKFLKSTEISKYGAMKGPALSFYDELLKKFPEVCIYASGGIRSIDDIKALQDIGMYGVIFGRAFYEGKITLKQIEEFVK